MKPLVHAIPHQSRPVGARQLPPGGSQGGWYEFALGFHNGILRTAGNPSGAMRRPQPCIKQLYAVEDGYTC